MAIRKSKINIDTEERSDFDNMMNDVENEVEEQQAEDGLVSRVPELKQLSEDIDKATNTFINATLELESAIQQYQRAEAKLGGAVTTISKHGINLTDMRLHLCGHPLAFFGKQFLNLLPVSIIDIYRHL